MQRYNPKDIEPKWQKIWDESGTYTADLTSDKPKYIAMSMFNYPSGAGIHIGHAMNYTISDVKARFKRQQGYESYHPVGWDAFGLPAENYAIKTGVSPQESMANIIPMYHKQYKAMGWSNDWEKEIATHLPEYYKWTQWIFVQMHKHGLAYQDSRMQWWCPIDKTVLANEQVIDGKCWRHDDPDDPPAEQKEVKQWFFKITAYADELLEATKDLDWSDSVKLAQENWIGKSVGAEIEFYLDGLSAMIPVFTTRPDTIFGATFIVVAPEWELLDKITSGDKKASVYAYKKKALAKSDVERQESKEKMGVFTGACAINPATNKKIEVWVADYVLAGYGTGAIMAVPAHDERDHEFAEMNDLPIVSVVKPSREDALKSKIIGPGTVVTHPQSTKLQRSEDQIVKSIEDGLVAYSGEGVMINSGDYNGLKSEIARQKIITDLEKKGVANPKTNYRMRDWSVSRQRYWGAPIPIIHCLKDGPVLVPEKDLPVVLPELDDFAPAGDGRSALARAKDWLEVACPKCGGPAERETDTMDTYVDSSWYMWRYFDPHNQQAIFDSNVVKKWEPVDFYNGADHATAHLLYARFFGHFFKKLGLINEPEPFKQFVFNGKVTSQDGSMFSKSKGNAPDPLDVINQGYGADAMRTYLMFAAPLELWTRWDPQGVPGAFRFLNRVWNLAEEYLETPDGKLSDKQEADINRSVHAMIKKMTEDLEANRYNTAIAAAMACTNDLYKFKTSNFGKNETWQKALESLVACIAPFAPHISEELWLKLGHHTTVHRDTWPKFDEKYLAQDQIIVVVQVNGKVRGQVQVAVDADETSVAEAAKANEKVAGYLKDQTIRKTVFVPGKLVNFVI